MKQTRTAGGPRVCVQSGRIGTGRAVALALSVLVVVALVFATAGRATAMAWGRSGSGGTPGAAIRAHAARTTPAQTATVLVYLNGSDLESEAGEASSDIAEMLKANVGTNVNVVIETLGTKKWQDHGIASDHTQRYVIRQNKLELVDDSLGQLDTTDPKTLSDFIRWGTSTYPADRYMLLLWDHGAGPVYGFGYDEYQSDYAALTLDEMQQALRENANVHFDLIGMDCCIMSSIETCKVLEPYCDYTILSEDFEPGVGWSYTRWLSMLEKNPNIDTVELGKVVVDDMIADVAADEENGDATLALIDESKIAALYDAWVAFARENEQALLSTNYSQETEWRGRPGGFGHHDANVPPEGYGAYDAYDGYGVDGMGDDMGGLPYDGWQDWDVDDSYVTMTDYFVTDMMEVASALGGTAAAELQAAFKEAVVHYGATAGETGMSGLSVTLPYGDAEFYDELVKVFTACGFDSDYVAWLEEFVGADGASYNNDYNYDYDYGFDTQALAA